MLVITAAPAAAAVCWSRRQASVIHCGHMGREYLVPNLLLGGPG